MNRQFNYSNPQSNTFHPNTISNRFQQQWNLRSPQTKTNIQSDLYIFNGDQPVKDIYHPQQNMHKPNLAFVPQKINKSPSQKAFPIIYNTYNQVGAQRQNKFQNIGSNHVYKPNHSKFNQYQEFNQRSHSNLSQKSDNHYNRQQSHNQFHTFQRIPPQNQPQTAKFLNIPERIQPDYFVPHEQYRPQQQRFENKQMSPPINYQSQMPINTVIHQPINTISHNKSASRIIQVPAPMISSPKPVFQEQQNQRFVTYSQQKSRLIQIPQQEYERYVDHLAQCRRNQQENVSLKGKAQELAQKQRFYWEQNMTLRQQNKRLRDLVSHFQKRDKELGKKNEEQMQHFDEQIIKYRDSTLQQFILLMERYKLQLQKKK